MWESYYTAGNIEDALEILDREGPSARIIAGGTDLVLELKNGSHPHVKSLVDINRIEGLDVIEEQGDQITLGPTVTHNQCMVSEPLLRYALPLVKAAASIGAPQIRNVGTVLGNLITASPANDTISPLIALDAAVTLRSKSGEREIKLADFYKGVRKIDMADNEMVVDVHFKKMKPNQKGSFIKYILRQAHAISVANASAILTMDDKGVISDAVITLGAVAPTIVRAKTAEKFLLGKTLDDAVIAEAAKLAEQTAVPSVTYALLRNTASISFRCWLKKH